MDPLLWKRLAVIFFIAAGVFILAFVYYSVTHKVISSVLYDMKQKKIKKNSPDPYEAVKEKTPENNTTVPKVNENIKKSTMIKQAVSTSENIRKTVPVGGKGEPVMKTVALKKGNTESASDPMQYTVAAARKNTSNNSMKFVIIRSETFMTCSEDEISCIDNV